MKKISLEAPISYFSGFKPIFKASLQSILSNKGSLFFSFIFPMIFVLIFGSFGKGGVQIFEFAIDKNIDTTDAYYNYLKQLPNIKLTPYAKADSLIIDEKIKKGKLTGILTINKLDSFPKYNIGIKSYGSNLDKIFQAKPFLKAIADSVEQRLYPNKPQFVSIKEEIISENRPYNTIDFILPGQLGFSILFATLFGTAFGFFSLRQELVLKRMFATPASKLGILFGIGTARLLFQLINILLLVAFGYFFLKFYLAKGWLTVLNLLIVSIIFLILLMSVGLLISSVAKSDTTIPLIINIFGLPQILLAGTFFPISVFPNVLQYFCKLMPLYHFNTAVRAICFEGASLIDCWQNIGVLCIWGFIFSALTYKFFRWS